jgi:Ca2+-binding RTX toxin-like protein
MDDGMNGWYKFILAQMAADSYLDQFDFADEPELRVRLRNGANHRDHIAKLEQEGRLGATRMTEVMIDDFLATWEVIDHIPNDTGGFSATLLRNRQTGKYTLSFRSTESKRWEDGGDNERDGGDGADGEISFDGFAWAQLHSMEQYFQHLLRGELYAAGYASSSAGDLVREALELDQITVTGYSLGSHLAQLFTLMHYDKVEHAYTFNGAGFGGFDGVQTGLPYGQAVLSKLDLYDRIMADPASFLDQFTLDELYANFNDAVLGTKEQVLAYLIDQHNNNTYQRIYDDPLYKYATLVLNRGTGGALWSGLVEPNEILPFLSIFGHGEDRTPDPKVTNLFGLSTQFDPEFVSGAGQIVGSFDGIFIENQPVLTYSNPKTFFDVFGDTHSITLIADTLAVMALFEQIDPQVDRRLLNGIFTAASKNRAQWYGVEPLPVDRVAEGDSLERVLDALGELLYGEAWQPTPYSRALGAYGDFALRNQFYENVRRVRDGLAGQTGTVQSLIGMDASEISSRAKSDAAYRYALLHLNPFAITGNASLYESHAEDLAPFSPEDGTGVVTEEYLADRAQLLEATLWFNFRDIDAAGTYYQTATPMPVTHYVDREIGVEATTFGDPATVRRQYVFGTEGDDAGDGALRGAEVEDHLYGCGGNDTLAGGAGSDHLEGGRDDDVYEELGERDVVFDAQGDDVYRIVGDANVTITDLDGIGSITWDGDTLPVATLLSPGLFGDGTPQDGAVFTSDDKVFTFSVAGKDLVITSTRHVGSTITIRDYGGLAAGNRLGLELRDAAANDGPAFIGSGGDDTIGMNPNELIPYTLVDAGAGRDTIYLGERLQNGSVDHFDLSGLTIHGGDGDDHVLTYRFDRFPSGSYNDIADTSGFGPRAFGDAGNDNMEGTSLADYFDGGSGHDVVLGFAGGDTVVGGIGNDWIDGGGGGDLLYGGEGNDRLLAGHAADVLHGGEGTDWLYGDSVTGVPMLVNGTSAWDGVNVVVFDVGPNFWMRDYYFVEDVTAEKAGRDEMRGGGGNDMLFGGFDNDALHGEAGEDYLAGEAGDDTLEGGDGDDILHGDVEPARFESDGRILATMPSSPPYLLRGRQYADGQLEAGHDTLRGGAGRDRLFGGGGDDVLEGGADGDLLKGEDGNDVLDGGSGDDILYGMDGDDVLRGGDGKDTLHGGDGNDTYLDGAGEDILIDTGGNDVYRTSGQWGAVLIDDAQGDDRLILDAMSRGVGVARVGSDLKIVSGTNSVSIRNWFAGNRIETIEFADGVVRTASELVAPLLAQNGTSGVDTLIGLDDADDRIFAALGNDELAGGSGNDTLDGGPGDDRIDGGDGDDILIGGGGDDTLTGGRGADTYALGAGNTSIIEDSSDAQVNVLRLPEGVAALGIEIQRFGNDLLMTYGEDSTVVTDYFQAPHLWDLRTFDGSSVDPAALDSPDLPDEAWVQKAWNTFYTRERARLAADIQRYNQEFGWQQSVFGRVQQSQPVGMSVSGGGETGAYLWTYLATDENGVPLVDEEGHMYVLQYYSPGALQDDEPRFSYPLLYVTNYSMVSNVQSGTAGADTVLRETPVRAFLGGGTETMWATLGSAYDRRQSGGREFFHRDIVRLSADIPDYATSEPLGSIGGKTGNRDGYVADVEVTGLGLGVKVVTTGGGNDVIGEQGTWSEGLPHWVWDTTRRSYQPAWEIGFHPSESGWYREFYGTPAPMLIDAGDGDDRVYGAPREDFLEGGQGEDVLVGFAGADVLAGGAHGDRLEGGYGADIYMIGQQDGGVDVALDDGYVNPNDGDDEGPPPDEYNDVVQINAAFSAVSVHRIAYGEDREALVLAWGPAEARSGVVSILGGSNDPDGFGVERYGFLDGAYTRAQLHALAITNSDPGVLIPLSVRDMNEAGVIVGTSAADEFVPDRWQAPFDPRAVEGLRVEAGAGDDRIQTGAADDTLDGGPGADVLGGGGGGDIYLFGRGDGHDLVLEDDISGDAPDRLQFRADVTAADVLPARSGNDLSLRIAGTDDVVSVPGYFDAPVSGARLERIVFSDGTEWDYAMLLSMTGNHAPEVGQAIAPAVIDEDAQLNLVLPEDAFIDADTGDALVYSASLAGGGELPGWLSFDAAQRTFRGVPANEDVGELEVVVTATDAHGAQAAQSFVLTVRNVNDAPMLGVPLADVSVREDLAFEINIPADSFGDVDVGDSLTYTAGLQDGTALPSWLQFDPAAGRFRGTAPSGAAGDYVVRLQAVDSGGLAAADEFLLTVEPAGVWLVGSDGADRLFGGEGDDTLQGLTGADLLSGLGGEDRLEGGGGSDHLDGGGGADVMAGGNGNDIYVVENAGDIVLEDPDQGLDTVISTIDWALGSNTEVLILTGNDAIGGVGNARSNLITGNANANLLDGGGGADILLGGAGDDTYVVDAAGDLTIELASEGADTVISSVTRTLGANLEHLVLSGLAAVNATGNRLDNWLRGNDASNHLAGGDGNDRVWGAEGSDVLLGGNGIDILQGGEGDDALTDLTGAGLLDGGGGADRLDGGGGSQFVIGGKGDDEIGAGSGVDVIAFNRGDGADIVLPSAGADNTLSLGGGIGYEDIMLVRNGFDLIVDLGEADSITVRDWYQDSGTASYASLSSLQVIVEAMAQFDASSSDPLLNRKVAQFDFGAIVQRFDQRLAADPGVGAWSLVDALAEFHVGGSDVAALGGDLAYQYGSAGTLAGLGATPMQGTLASSQFGVVPQTFQSLASLQTGMVRLA